MSTPFTPFIAPDAPVFQPLTVEDLTYSYAHHILQPCGCGAVEPPDGKTILKPGCKWGISRLQFLEDFPGNGYFNENYEELLNHLMAENPDTEMWRDLWTKP